MLRGERSCAAQWAGGAASHDAPGKTGGGGSELGNDGNTKAAEEAAFFSCLPCTRLISGYSARL